MTQLPITHMTLYKHGVGFFERRAKLTAPEVELSFRVEEMNDILKSLTAIDWGGGQVLGIDYATPQDQEELLSGCSVRLDDDRSLRDLLIGLRGRQVRLLLDQGEEVAGLLVGLDELPERQPLGNSLVSLLAEASNQINTYLLSRLQSVVVLDERGISDLRFFLKTSLSQENYRQVTIRLTADDDHDLSVSYIAPAPTWRVSYRLVADTSGDKKQALLMGWGIFDNRLEEDLEDISLSLVAGMPISFVYDLYTPFTPERPVVEEESRVAAAPVMFAEAMPDQFVSRATSAGGAPQAAPAPKMAAPRARMDIADVADSAVVTTSGNSLGELFEYNIGTPVTVQRGHSAMVPIISARLAPQKDLLYNGRKMPTHPVATMRLKNESGLTLERGPVTVIENGGYVGEAMVDFTAADGQIVVAYSVELSIKIQEMSGSTREIYQLKIEDGYLIVEEWDVRWHTYQVNNNISQQKTVLIEHPRQTYYDLIDTATPKEITADHWRFEVVVDGRGEATLTVRSRRLLRRREELQRQSLSGLQNYLSRGLIDRLTHDKVAELLRLWGRIHENEIALNQVEQDRQKIYRAQQQIQGNMQALSQSGKEGALRTQYVEQLEASEGELKKLANTEALYKKEIAQWQAEIEQKLKKL